MDNDNDNSQALNRFLQGVERRAFRMAQLATGDSEAALEIVQDAMLTLVRNYRDKSEADWGPLFHRILQSRIRDWYRRSSIRNRLFGWLRTDEEHDGDPLQQAEDVDAVMPERAGAGSEAMQHIMHALRQLPLRQQQTFVLRAWEGYSTEETARVMNCSQGSVKTHYSRALKAMRDKLQRYDDE